MTAKQILEMIEQVSPDDVAGLDEIDLAVEVYVGNYSLVKTGVDANNQNDSDIYAPNGKIPEGVQLPPLGVIGKHFMVRRVKYTRSRDALKSIRPEGWSFSISDKGNCLYFSNGYSDKKVLSAGTLHTEELAELHAIIQAIEYERNNK